MRAGELMQEGVVSVSPELPVAELEELLVGEEITGAPVLGSRGELLGIVSQTDIVRAIGESGPADLKELLAPELCVEEIMTRDVLVVSEGDDVRDVARKMLESKVHRALVHDGDTIVGIISAFDMLRVIA
jgi:IMP dehydrogenase